MTTYTMTGPDGKDYSIDGPPGATQEQVRAQMQKAHADLSAPASGGSVVNRIARAVGAPQVGDNPNAPSSFGGTTDALQSGIANAGSFGLIKTDPNAADHPIATGVGQVIGGVISGGGLLKGAEAVAARAAPRAVATAGRALTLRAGQPVVNAARLVGSGATAGGVQGAVTGGIAGAQQDGAAAVIPGAVTGAAENAVVGGLAGPVVAGAAKGVQTVAAALAPASKRAIALLAKHLDMSADGVESMVTDHMVATGRPPTLADILNAKSVANLEPITTARQGPHAAMQAADAANQGLLPGRQVIDVVNAADNGTKTPLAAAPKLIAARKAPLEEMRDAQATATMDPIRTHAVNLQPSEADFLKGEVTSAMGLRGPIRKQIADELGKNQISIQSIDAIRKNLNKLDLANPGQGYADIAHDVEQIGRAHPEYGKMLDEYAANSRFIDGFNHANAGNSALDASGAGQRAALQSDEGQAGLQVGARSRMVATAGASRSGATRTTAQLAQDTVTAANESLPQTEVEKLRRSAQAEQRSQSNYGRLAGGNLTSKMEENTKAIKSAGEAGVAAMAHAFPTTRYHAVTRWLASGAVRESTAKEIVDILISRDPAVLKTLPDKLRAAGVSAEKQRVILNVAAKRGAAGAGAIFNSLTNGQ